MHAAWVSVVRLIPQAAVAGGGDLADERPLRGQRRDDNAVVVQVEVGCAGDLQLAELADGGGGSVAVGRADDVDDLERAGTEARNACGACGHRDVAVAGGRDGQTIAVPVMLTAASPPTPPAVAAGSVWETRMPL